MMFRLYLLLALIFTLGGVFPANALEQCLAIFPNVNQEYGPKLTLPTFDDSDEDIGDISGSDLALPEGQYTDITVDEGGVASFTTLNGNYSITELDVAERATVRFVGGDYFIDDLTLGEKSTLVVEGSDTVRIYANQISIGEKARINDANGSLILISYDDIEVDEKVHFTGVMYALDDIELDEKTVILGSITAKELDIDNPTSISYQESSITNSDFNGMCDNSSLPIEPDSIPILDYRFDECAYTGVSNKVTDESNVYHGTAEGFPNTIDDIIINKSIDLIAEGTDEWVKVPNNAINGLHDFTVAVWLNTSVNDKSQQEILHALGNKTDDDELEIYLTDNDEVRVNVRDEGDDLNLKNNVKLTDGNWHHMVITRDGSNICLYVDGDKQDCHDKAKSGTLTVSGSDRVVLGQEQDSYGGGFEPEQSFEGKLDEFKIYNSILDDAEIIGIYQNEVAGKNYDGSTRDAVDCNLVELVAGRVTLNNTVNDPTFTHVCFDTPFSVVPLVFSLPTTANNSNRLALRIKNVTKDGFDIAQVESPEDANPNAPAGNLPQTVDFLAIVEGDYDLDGGAKMRVRSLNTTTFQGRFLGNNGKGWETVFTTNLGFSQTPAIIASIQTMNNEPNLNNLTGPFPISDPFMATTVRNVTNSQFQIALERGETNSGTIANAETIGYIAISSGFQGNLTSDITYESFRTGNNITGINTCREFNFTDNYTDNPLVIASQNTRAGTDGGWLKRCSISNSSAGFSIVEDGDRDMDTNHINERAGGITLGGSFNDFTNSCPGTIIDHFEIDTQDGQGLTCEADEIIIKACADSACDTINPDAVDVKLSINGTEYKTVTVSGVNGTTTTYPYTTIGNAELSLDQTYECTQTKGSKPCIVDFKDSGFIISNIPLQLSGKSSNEGFNATTLSLQAVETDTNTGACIGTFADDTNVAVNLSYSCAGGDCKDLLALSNNGNSYNLTEIAIPQDLYFSTDSTAIFTLKYPHAGKFIIKAQKDVEVEDSDGSKIIKDFSASSNAFVERPFGIKLDFSNDSNGSEAFAEKPSGIIDIGGSPFKKAGESFTLTATAMQWVNGQDETGAGSVPDGIPDDFAVFNQNTIKADNFAGGEITLNKTLLLPMPGNTPDLNVISSNSFSVGTSSLNNEYSFDEVGIIELNSTLANDYLGGGDVLGKVTNVGRFTPAYFTQGIQINGKLNSYHYDTCNPLTNNWVYAGQKRLSGVDEVGAISYRVGLAPVINITAYNLNGYITQNYTETGFMNLVKSGIDITVPISDNEALRVEPTIVDEKIALNSVMSKGDEPVTSTIKGIVTYTFNPSDHFFYEHNKHSKTAPFPAKIPFLITRIEDEDNINLYSGSNTNVITTVKVITDGVEIRFGRWLLENSYGPETSRLPVTMFTQIFDGTTFINNELENCQVPSIGAKEPTGVIGEGGMELWRYRLADIDAFDNLLPSHTTPSVEAKSFVSGLYQSLFFSAPGSGRQGSLEFEYQVPAWLQYDWNSDNKFINNPTATLTFGIYRGNDRVIYQREIETVN